MFVRTVSEKARVTVFLQNYFRKCGPCCLPALRKQHTTPLPLSLLLGAGAIEACASACQPKPFAGASKSPSISMPVPSVLEQPNPRPGSCPGKRTRAAQPKTRLMPRQENESSRTLAAEEQPRVRLAMTSHKPISLTARQAVNPNLVNLQTCCWEAATDQGPWAMHDHLLTQPLASIRRDPLQAPNPATPYRHQTQTLAIPAST